MKRRSFKSQITHFNKYLDSYQDCEKNRVKLRERIERLRNQFGTFNGIQDELALIEDFDQAEAEREEVTEQFDDTLATAVVLMNRFVASVNLIPPPNIEIVSRDLPAPSAASSFPLSVKLPKIDLQKFDGRIEKWVTFRDGFKTTIHAIPGLSNIQKLNYLRASLSGKAESAIEAYTITDDNYEAVWDHLLEIYENKRALVLRHASLLVDTPAMPNDSSESNRDLANHMQLHIRSLQALGRSWEDIANDLLLSIAVSSMAEDARKAWERTLSDMEVPKIATVFKHLHIAAHQCEEYSTSRGNAGRDLPDEHRTDSVAQRRNDTSNTYRAKPARAPKSPPSPRKTRQTFATNRYPNCKICHADSHAAYQCTQFLELSIEKRIEAARKARLCMNCLRSDHKTDECKAGKCRVCNKTHNTRLHLDTQNES
ncbi:uncharacterized protein LOC143374563 [Andrena cerasifolii]|uniref:uncharacterized protein LOC143374563 n=1 Tax=Andrena cerasifolii TaxID=2819439 RepID=UPI004037F9B0